MSYRKRLIFIFILFVLLPGMAAAETMTSFTGSVTTFDNKTVEGLLCSEVSNDYSKNEPIPDEVKLFIQNSAGQSQSYEISTTDISKVIFSGKKTKHGRTNFVVRLKNGKEFEQLDNRPLLMPDEKIYVSSRNPITGELSFDRIYWTKVKVIRLHEPHGQVRRDELGNIFPADYKYSPFTGKPMDLHSIE
jgi:hypothetical protein